jgi:hypothetical protein
MFLCAAFFAMRASVASATLLDRGPYMVYDDVLHLTWVRDASLCLTLNNYINPDAWIVNGGMTWGDATVWAETLTYQGYSDWRLPRIHVTSPSLVASNCETGSALDCAASGNELAYMFYYDLGGTWGGDKTGNQTTVNGQQLTNIQTDYWSSSEYDASFVWFFHFNNGGRSIDWKEFALAAWAVRDGDVAAIPEPGTCALLLTSLGLLGLRRRNNKLIA